MDKSYFIKKKLKYNKRENDGREFIASINERQSQILKLKKDKKEEQRKAANFFFFFRSLTKPVKQNVPLADL